MAAEPDELDRLLADIAKNITENRRFLHTLLDERSDDDLDEGTDEKDDETEEEFEEL